MTVRADDVAAALAGRPALLRDTCDRALAYLDGLAGRSVAPAAADGASLGAARWERTRPGLRWPRSRGRGGQLPSRMPAMISTLAAGVAASMQTRSITRR